ncbi:MAG: response regulator, partial [Mesorhizobium sp.]
MTARILVVDDIPANVRLLEVRLLAEYFEVLTATNGPDAIETCENGKVDVVLLDVMMPDIEELLSGNFASEDTTPKVLLIDERKSSVERIQKMLRDRADLDVTHDPHAGFFQAAETSYECVMISTAFADFDPLRLCSQLRSLDRTRFVPI